jgi:hypothetical protein
MKRRFILRNTDVILSASLGSSRWAPREAARPVLSAAAGARCESAR